MEIKKHEMGMLGTNSYIVYENSEAYIIDLGGENIEKIIRFLEDNNLNLKGVIFTHGHYDHLAGLKELTEYKNEIEVYIGEKEKECLTDPWLNLSGMIGFEGVKFDVGKMNIKTVKAGDKIWKFSVIETPGHTVGSISLYCSEEKVVFSGDLIFKESYGRTDFPGGNYITLMDSIKSIIALGDDITIYTGHYLATDTKEYGEWLNNSMGDY